MKKIEYILVVILFALFTRIPFAIVKYIGLILAFITQYIIRYRPNLVKENLRRAFPDYDEAKIKQITTEVYINFTYFFVEWLQSRRFTKEFAEKNSIIENFEIVGEAVAKGK